MPRYSWYTAKFSVKYQSINYMYMYTQLASATVQQPIMYW